MTSEVEKKRGISQKRLLRYLEEISQYPLLSPEEEVELRRRIREGDQEALDKLVQANLRFVVSVAKEYQGRGLPLLDLINEGNLGLIKAAQRFDETKGYKFISYAVWWIRQAIAQALAEQSRVVRLPLSRVNVLYRIGRVSDTLEQELERIPTAEEIAEHMDLEDEEVTEALQLAENQVSLDAPLMEHGEDSLLEFIPDIRSTSPEELINSKSRQKAIDEALNTLPPKEAEVIRLYFGIGKDRSYSLAEIGEKMGVSRERVRQIKVKALRKLRHNSRSKRLRVFLN